MSSFFSFIPKLHPNVWLLMLAQSLIGSIGPVIVFVGGFVGLKLAPNQALATLPVACMVIGIAFFMVPMVKLLANIGRKKGFIISVVAGSINCLFTAYCIIIGNFWLFCFSVFLFGILIAGAQQFRFAAMESMPDEKAGQAVSVLLLAGLVAAFLGPEIAFLGKDWFADEFAGSFIGVGVIIATSLVFLAFYQPVDKHHAHSEGQGRPLRDIVTQPVFIAAITSATVGFAVMSFIMTATPISMHVQSGFNMEDTKWVIQSHIIAMYLPSFFTGKVIQKFGHEKTLYAGIAVLAGCIAIGFLGRHYVHYWWALVLLGVGWNFMFVTATALLPQSYSAEEKFRVQGLNDLVIFSCQAVASLSAGLVIKLFGWDMLLLSCVPFLIISAITIVYWQKSGQMRANQPG